MIKQAAAALIACAMVASPAAPAALAQERAPRLGVVDMSKVFDGYKQFQESEKTYQEFMRARQAEFVERTSLRLLGEDELKEYQNLKAVIAPSDEQKQRMEQLKEMARTRDMELKGLQVVSNPTEENKRRTAELQELARKRDDELSQLQKRMGEEISQRNKELSDNLNHQIETALAAVAKDKQIDVVLTKEVVLYGGRDLTPDLLTKLNATAAPSQ